MDPTCYCISGMFLSLYTLLPYSIVTVGLVWSISSPLVTLKKMPLIMMVVGWQPYWVWGERTGENLIFTPPLLEVKLPHQAGGGNTFTGTTTRPPLWIVKAEQTYSRMAVNDNCVGWESLSPRLDRKFIWIIGNSVFRNICLPHIFQMQLFIISFPLFWHNSIFPVWYFLCVNLKNRRAWFPCLSKVSWNNNIIVWRRAAYCHCDERLYALWVSENRIQCERRALHWVQNDRVHCGWLSQQE